MHEKKKDRKTAQPKHECSTIHMSQYNLNKHIQYVLFLHSRIAITCSIFCIVSFVINLFIYIANFYFLTSFKVLSHDIHY